MRAAVMNNVCSCAGDQKGVGSNPKDRVILAIWPLSKALNSRSKSCLTLGWAKNIH